MQGSSSRLVSSAGTQSGTSRDGKSQIAQYFLIVSFVFFSLWSADKMVKKGEARLSLYRLATTDTSTKNAKTKPCPSYPDPAVKACGPEKIRLTGPRLDANHKQASISLGMVASLTLATGYASPSRGYTALPRQASIGSTRPRSQRGCCFAQIDKRPTHG